MRERERVLKISRVSRARARAREGLSVFPLPARNFGASRVGGRRAASPPDGKPIAWHHGCACIRENFSGEEDRREGGGGRIEVRVRARKVRKSGVRDASNSAE